MTCSATRPMAASRSCCSRSRKLSRCVKPGLPSVKGQSPAGHAGRVWSLTSRSPHPSRLPLLWPRSPGFARWIRAAWWIRCIPVHSIHRQARIHRNPGPGLGHCGHARGVLPHTHHWILGGTRSRVAAVHRSGVSSCREALDRRSRRFTPLSCSSATSVLASGIAGDSTNPRPDRICGKCTFLGFGTSWHVA
jgi:hypothetical protein